MHVDCGTLVDGARTVWEDARVRIDGGRIEAVGPRDEVEAGSDDGDETDETSLDFSDRVVVPGFVDAHVHLQGLRSMDPTDWVLANEATCAARATVDCRRLLEAGFTSVRDVGSTVGIGPRNAIATGEVPGPRIYRRSRPSARGLPPRVTPVG